MVPDERMSVMKLTVKGKNITITDALENYVEKRFDKLEKYFQDEMHGTVTLSIEKNAQIAEATFPINHYILRAEDSSDDMYASIDGIVEKIERQIRKYKTRVNRKARQQNQAMLAFKPFEDDVEPSDDSMQLSDGIEITKVKSFNVKPMDPEEAVMQMELLDHDFFVFLNDESQAIDVVYRRKDGKYGLIQPETN